MLILWSTSVELLPLNSRHPYRIEKGTAKENQQQSVDMATHS